MKSIEYAIPPLIGNIFDDLVTNLIPRVGYACPFNAIFILYKMFIVLEEIFLVACPFGFSSFLQGNPRGSVVILLINSGVISM